MSACAPNYGLFGAPSSVYDTSWTSTRTELIVRAASAASV
jgi:hypothetical protein